MTPGLHLICHKVRGEKAYDVAIQMECPECNGAAAQERIDGVMFCYECDDLGHWWIIPTSGHRAHPVMDYPLNELSLTLGHADDNVLDLPVPDLTTVEDHYQVAFAPRSAAVDTRPEFLRALLRRPQVTINRRGL